MKRLTPRERESYGKAKASRPVRVLHIERVSVRVAGEVISVPRVRFLERVEAGRV